MKNIIITTLTMILLVWIDHFPYWLALVLAVIGAYLVSKIAVKAAKYDELTNGNFNSRQP